ncbi:DUF2750 domain-containing protein [Dongia deserti]|uniref:DUF2750 domain-containing protein n=1 Tax=Dongia deserti TaxID=2268030 RepID=UPI000E65153B|nr:DUF2750 domain-containing protein [Dongia deserti]
MSQASSQAHAFYKDIATSRHVWGIRDSGGIPAPKGDGGKRVMPFWSSLGRVETIIKTVPAYAGFEPFELNWDEFRDEWLAGLERDGLLVGVNWSGPRAVGFDVEPKSVRLAVEAYIEDQETS